LAADKFNAQPWWYRWSTASGWPRRLSYAVLPPETPIKIDSDVLDPDCEDEIEIRLNGEACCGWLAVWDPPAAAEPSSPAATPKAKRQIKQANQPERLQRRLVNAGLDRLRSEYPAKYRKGFRKTSPAVLMRQMKPFWAKICEGESVSPADYPLDKMWDTVA